MCLKQCYKKDTLLKQSHVRIDAEDILIIYNFWEQYRVVIKVSPNFIQKKVHGLG